MIAFVATFVSCTIKAYEKSNAASFSAESRLGSNKVKLRKKCQWKAVIRCEIPVG